MPDFKLALDLAGRMIEEHLELVLAAEQAKAEELGDEYRPHEELHLASLEVRAQLVFMRPLLSAVYGATIAKEIIGTEGPTAKTDQPRLLERQGADVVQQLRQVDLELVERSTEGCEVNAFALAHDLELALTWLKQAQKDVDSRRHRLHRLLSAKARCLKELDAAYRAVVSFVKGLCLLAGSPDRAREIKAGWLKGAK